MTDQNCIFCKIVAGDIPSEKVYEDDDYLAFLDTNPVQPGHTLLVPKAHHEYLFDMPDEAYLELLLRAKKLAPAIQRATDSLRIGVIVEGFAVPHVHLHLVPISNGNELDPNLAKHASSIELAEMADKIRMTTL